jgi:hypothetical protein
LKIDTSGKLPRLHYLLGLTLAQKSDFQGSGRKPADVSATGADREGRGNRQKAASGYREVRGGHSGSSAPKQQ